MSESLAEKERIYSEKQRIFAREYYRKNKEHINELRKIRFEKNPEKHRKYDREWKQKWRDTHKEENNAVHREFYKQHKDHYLERAKQYAQTHKEERKIYNKKRWQENKERLSEWHKEWLADLRFEVLAIYSEGQPKCVCCGETTVEFLTIDHIGKRGIGAKHRKDNNIKGGSPFYSWLKNNDFPEGFRVLCYNCNCSRGRFGYCPHEFEHGVS